jgi:hypothetical protein
MRESWGDTISSNRSFGSGSGLGQLSTTQKNGKELGDVNRD